MPISVALQGSRIAVRSLRRTPGFAATAVLTLALGIGLATAVFTVAEAMLLRRLPVRDQDRIVVLWGELRGKDFVNYPLSIDDAQQFARSARTLAQTGFFLYEGAMPILVRDGAEYSRMRRALVSGEFFGVLGVHPAIGRALRPEDNVRGSAHVIVLSYNTWQQRFGGDPNVIGRRVLLHEQGVMHSIVGVMPQGLDYPRGADFWAPVIPSVSERAMPYVALHVIGRLAPNATPVAARDELTAFYQRPGTSLMQRNLTGVVHTLPQLIVGDTRAALLTFAAASALLLLITCINVANLLLVRGLGRVREIAVRSAIGAKRGRIIGQLLTENALLALVGGTLGVIIAAAAVQAFVAFAPAGIPRIDEIGLNPTVLTGALGLTAGAMLIFALAPAIMTSRVELNEVLRADTRQTASKQRRTVSEALVAMQIALALIVLSATGIVAKSLLKLQQADLSLQPERLLIAELALRYDQFDDPQKQLALLDRVSARLESLADVRALSAVVAAPFAISGGWDGRPTAEGQTATEAAANPMLSMDVVSPGYFSTLGIPLLRGRGFTEVDRVGSPPVVVLSQSAADYYWPQQDPIGKRVLLGPPGENPPALTVIGVVPDTRYRELRNARPSIYFAMRQSTFPFVPTTLAIRTTGRPEHIIPLLRNAVEATDPGVALASAAPFDAFLNEPLAQPRLNTLLLAVFAAAAVALAAIGLFAVMATMVRQRTRELGVRMALGATRADVRQLLLRRGVAIAAAGLTIGLGASLVLNRLIVSLLYEVSPTDVQTLALVAALLLAIALIASFIPARASTRIDPVRALRSEG